MTELRNLPPQTAPPFEKEQREDFKYPQDLLKSITKTFRPDQLAPTEYEQIRDFNRETRKIKAVPDGKLSVNAVKALHALLAIMEDRESKEVEIKEDTLKVKAAKYYGYFGVGKRKKGFQSNHKVNAEKGLMELALTFFCLNYVYSSGERQLNVNDKYSPLIRPIEDKKIKRETFFERGRLTLKFDRIMLFSLKRDYFYVPKDINKQVQEHTNGKRISASAYLFNTYIHLLKGAAKNKKVSISYDKLIQVMQLEKEREIWHYTRISRYLLAAFEIAADRGVITKIQADKGSKGQDIYIFYWQ